MNRPILFIAAGDRPVVAALERDLGRRFGNDCRIATGYTPAEGLARLRGLAREGAPVALLIADRQLGKIDYHRLCALTVRDRATGVPSCTSTSPSSEAGARPAGALLPLPTTAAYSG